MINDPILGVHGEALRLRAHRSEVLAANLANAETPHYKARDFDFAGALERAETGVGLERTHASHLSAGAGPGMPEKLYRMPHQPALDGNTVEADVEQAAFSENAMHYLATLRFISGRMQTLRAAITGGR